MADVAASVLARLKNKAAKSGRSYRLCLQLFCQEEFLRRLEKSKYAENLVLKGGLFLYSLTDFDSRVTADVDFLLRKMPNTSEQLQAILEEIIATETGNDFITFEIKNVAPIAVAKKYAGIGASLVAKIKNTKTPFGIDFGVGDVIVPRQKKRKIPTQLDGFEAPTVKTYSLETTVAEKLDAILSLMEFSSRMKDYYDLYYLANKFDFDGATLTEALKKTFENRGHKFTMEQFEQVMAFGSDDAMQKKWKAFCRKIDTKTDDFNVVLRTLEWAPVENAFSDKKCLKLALQNCGTDIDEDIEISLRIPKNSLLPINEFPKFNNDEMGYLLNDCNMSELFGICSTSTYSDYDTSIATSRRFSPRVSTPSIFPGYTPDYSDDFESELSDVFCYSCFDEGEEYIVKLKFDYIKHNTTIAFPSIIFIKEPFKAMLYTITSKNSPEIVSGEIKITDDARI